MLVPEWAELVAVWHSVKSSGPGWRELAAAVAKVLDHSEGRVSVGSKDK